ncbi:MAG: class I SAM-dependent methyltransferase, partial [Candidatus Rokuibacteriota bacterium]
MPVVADLGSFRDPGGRIYLLEDCVYRTVTPAAVEDFEHVERSGLIEALVERGQVLPATKVDGAILGNKADGAHYVVQHPKLPFVSYPYEWPFAALKAAALLHLDIHLEALRRGVTLSDASAFNIQFIGARPVFIDRLSFVRYRPGEIWVGHRQFCEQFLNPLLLRALFGVSHNAWYRGAQEGIAADDLRRLLRWRHKLSW